MEDFKDKFSSQAEIYSRYRPTYPDALFRYLHSLTTEHSLAWDCGTGNGQAARGLADLFDHVIATDPSAEQLAHSIPHPHIQYSIGRAETSPLQNNAADLITVANAVHWFALDLFYAEVNRVLKPGGAVAVWCYASPIIREDVDRIVKHFSGVTLNEYWLEENHIVEREYQTLRFPFKDVETRIFYAEKYFDREDLIQYLKTWSAVQTFLKTNGVDPTRELTEALDKVWPDVTENRKATWKIVLKSGRK